MVKPNKIYLSFVFIGILCLKMTLVSAQTPITLPTEAELSTPGPLQPSTTPTPTPTPTTTNSTPSAGGSSVDPKSILNIDASSSGKYEEYQSICRSREFDKLKYQSKELYQAQLKKIEELTQKVMASKSTNNKFTSAFLLLKQQIDNDDIKNFNLLSTFLKTKKFKPVDANKLNAFIAYSKKNYREAINLFLTVIAEDENNELVLKTMAEIYTIENNFFEASTIYEDLNKIKKNAYLVELCEAMVSNSLNADGETICMIASKKFPKNPFPLIYAGITFRERQFFKRARELFRQANNIKPTEMGNVCLAELSVMESKSEEAIKYFKLSVEQSPESIRAVLGLAWAQMKAQNYEEALEVFTKACKINSKYESEMRKAYKKLVDENIPDSEKFMRASLSCKDTSL